MYIKITVSKLYLKSLKSFQMGDGPLKTQKKRIKKKQIT